MSEDAKTTHTPGPWFVGEVTMVDVETDAERPDQWHAYVHDNGCLEANVSSDRAFADARLIAAAPDMLAALEFIAQMGGLTLIAPSLGEDGDKGHQLGAFKAFNQAASIAKDAIAKANAADTPLTQRT